jgi:hypothetical protein
MNAYPRLNDETRRQARLTMVKVRTAIEQGDKPWSELQQHLAIHLIRFLAYGTTSKQLVRKITHVITDEHVSFPETDGQFAIMGCKETDQYVGLWPWQQLLIERSFQEACQSTDAPVSSSAS